MAMASAARKVRGLTAWQGVSEQQREVWVPAVCCVARPWCSHHTPRPSMHATALPAAYPRCAQPPYHSSTLPACLPAAASSVCGGNLCCEKGCNGNICCTTSEPAAAGVGRMAWMPAAVPPSSNRMLTAPMGGTCSAGCNALCPRHKQCAPAQPSASMHLLCCREVR